MPTERPCARCGRPIRERGRRKYCSDACANSAMRDAIRLKKAQLGTLGKIRWVRHSPGT